MNVLIDTFNFFENNPETGGSQWVMYATLTGTKLSGLAGFVATAGTAGVTVTYAPGTRGLTPASINFDVTLQYQVHPGKQAPISVTLWANPPVTVGGGYTYTMKIVLPWTTVNCTANVDATSNVVYGSQGDQFVTLVLNANLLPPPPPIK